MSLESAIEAAIQQAIARGEFDDLKGKGKPLDLTSYFETPEELRMAYAMLRSNEFVPGEVELMKEIAELKLKLNETPDENLKVPLRIKINDRSLALKIALEKYARRR